MKSATTWTFSSSISRIKKKLKVLSLSFLQVRNFVPPQADQPEVYIMDQEAYTGNYGGDGTKPGAFPPQSLIRFPPSGFHLL